MTAVERPLVNRLQARLRRITDRARQRAHGWHVRIRQRPGAPIPPGRLIFQVANSEDVDWFLSSGRDAAHSLHAILATQGLPFGDFPRVLDFGCGVGRVLRHLATPGGPELHGCDPNPAAVAWCQRHLRFASFRVNDPDKPLDCPSGRFDLIYAFSVFTHLSQQRQFHWMGELNRLLAPGGVLVFSTHGVGFLDHLSPAERVQFLAGELVVQGARSDGSNDCAAFHPPSYVGTVLARGFEVVQHSIGGAWGCPGQDLYLLRKQDAPRG